MFSLFLWSFARINAASLHASSSQGILQQEDTRLLRDNDAQFNEPSFQLPASGAKVATPDQFFSSLDFSGLETPHGQRHNSSITLDLRELGLDSELGLDTELGLDSNLLSANGTSVPKPSEVVVQKKNSTDGQEIGLQALEVQAAVGDREKSKAEQEFDQLKMELDKKYAGKPNFLDADDPFFGGQNTMDDAIEQYAQKMKKEFARMFRSKLIEKFGTSGTLLTMEWPGRVLNELTYKYPIKDSYDPYFKPLPVRDAEFDLADELFPLARYCSGPTGQSLSLTYQMMVDELTEHSDYGNSDFDQRKKDTVVKLTEQIHTDSRVAEWIKKQEEREETAALLKKTLEAKKEFEEALRKKSEAKQRSEAVSKMARAVSEYTKRTDAANKETETFNQQTAESKEKVDKLTGKEESEGSEGARRRLLQTSTTTVPVTTTTVPASTTTVPVTTTTVPANTTTAERKFSLMEIHDYYQEQYVSTQWQMTKMLNKFRGDARTAPDESSRAKVFDKIPSVIDYIHHQLNKKWSELVLSGHHHEVEAMLSFLDIRSPGEYLQETKNSIRNSASRSLDGTKRVYPVVLQPTNWAESLTTKFTSQDLTANTDDLLEEIEMMMASQDSIKEELKQLLTSQPVSAKDLEKLQKKAEKAEEEKRTEESMVPPESRYLEMFCNKNPTDCEKANAQKTEKAWEPVAQGMKEMCFTLNDKCKGSWFSRTLCSCTSLGDVKRVKLAYQNYLTKLLDANEQSESYSEAALGNFMAKDVGAGARHKARLMDQLEELERAMGVKMAQYRAKGGTATSIGNGDAIFPAISNTAPWISIELKMSASSSSGNMELGTSLKRGNSFGSGGGFDVGSSASKASSITSQLFNKDTTIDIGFSATKISIQRGAWFNPMFFRVSGFFMKTSNLENMYISNGDPHDLASDVIYPEAEKLRLYNAGNPMFPTYPVAFVLMRDATIRVRSSNSNRNFSSTSRSEASNSVGITTKTSRGFFKKKKTTTTTVSVSGSHASVQSSENEENEDGMTIRAPGPQIIAWLQEFTPKDLSEKFVYRSKEQETEQPPQ